MGWSYSFWKGNFYPENLFAKDFLAYYSRKLNSVEVDSSFYRIPSEKTVSDWKQQAPEGFTFSFKFPAKITHIKLLKDCQEETRVFLDRVSILGEKLGVLLIQLPPTFSNKQFVVLVTFLKELPHGYRYSLEVRNRLLLGADLYAVLREQGIALAWVDSAKMPLVEESTVDFAYVRWEGDRKKVTGTLGKKEIDRTADIQAWAKKIVGLTTRGREVFGYFSKYYSGLPPLDAAEFMESATKF